MKLEGFIKHCMASDEFWKRGGIPEDEQHYIEGLQLTEDEVTEFYKAMCSLQHLHKVIENQQRGPEGTWEVGAMIDGHYYCFPVLANSLDGAFEAAYDKINALGFGAFENQVVNAHRVIKE